MRKMIMAALAGTMLVGSAQAATVVYGGSSQVAQSVQGVLVGGTSYDVTFDGTATSFTPGNATDYSSIVRQLLGALNGSTAGFVQFAGGSINNFAVLSATNTGTTLYSLEQGVWNDLGQIYNTAAVANFKLSGAVPEPASWAMMVVGFGLLGAAMRRRNVKVSFA